jgi:hypothetical protein
MPHEIAPLHPNALTLRESHLLLCEMGVSGPTRMQIQNAYDAYRRYGYSVRQAIREVEEDYRVKNVQVDASGRTIVNYETTNGVAEATIPNRTRSAEMAALLSQFTGHKIDFCPTCGNMLAHRGGVALPCPKCNPKPTKPEATAEEYRSHTPINQWTNEHPGYAFTAVAMTPKGRVTVSHSPSFPAARKAANEHYRKTGERVDVYDQSGRKYYTATKLHEGVTPLQAALVQTFQTEVPVHHVYEIMQYVDPSQLKFEIGVAKRLKFDDVDVRLTTGKRLSVPLDQAQELAKAWNATVRSIVKSRW